MSLTCDGDRHANARHEGLTPHQRAVLTLPVEQLAYEMLLGFDLDSIELSSGGGYSIMIPREWKASEETRFCGSQAGLQLFRDPPAPAQWKDIGG